MESLPKDVAEFIQATYGEKTKEVVEALRAMGRATDTDLSELLSERPSHIRKILYSLYEARIADYEEHREPGTGWLTFVWTLTPEQGRRALETARRRAAAELKDRIEYEKRHDFYRCPDGHERVEFAAAADHRFHCSSCGAMLEHDDAAERLASLMQQLQGLERGTA